MGKCAVLEDNRMMEEIDDTFKVLFCNKSDYFRYSR